MRRSLASALERLSAEEVGRCRWGENLAGHSRWRIGGPADLYVEPHSVAQVESIRKAAARLGIPTLFFGAGSNLLFPDEGVRGLVVRLGPGLSAVSVSGNTVVCEAGAFVPQLARRAAGAGLAGLEHAIGIPGTLGGLVVMNGGSMRQAIGDVVDRVWAVDENGRLLELRNEQCEFGRRTSVFLRRSLVVVRVSLQLHSGKPDELRKEMLSVMRTRRAKFPLKQPNCGSVFVSDPELFATIGAPGRVIEACGLKGRTIGGATVSPMHANFIVNNGFARAQDVMDLIQAVRQVVREKTGVLLQCEVRYVSERGAVCPAHEYFERQAAL